MRTTKTLAQLTLVLALWPLASCCQTMSAPPIKSDISAPASADSHADHPVGIAPDVALQRLLAGNARFVSGKVEHPDRSAERRSEVAKGQYPFAVILSCSDSRVPPEIVFDTGLGDLFVVRVAGNTADDVAIGSIEYAVEHLGARLILVLGHEQCGAVKAAMVDAADAETPHGHIGSVVAPILPAVQKVKAAEINNATVEKVVEANAQLVAAKLQASKPILAKLQSDGKIQIHPAVYDLETGSIRIPK